MGFQPEAANDNGPPESWLKRHFLLIAFTSIILITLGVSSLIAWGVYTLTDSVILSLGAGFIPFGIVAVALLGLRELGRLFFRDR